ncbi:hypothetical protein [Pseudonocardia asaccharolytica]|nr:hypothetical protein [Pseudonocardia asaccharolytica]
MPPEEATEEPAERAGARRDDAERAINLYREYYTPLLGFVTRLTGRT